LTQAAVQAELAKVLGHYALGEFITAQRIEQGFVNENWAVTTDRGRFFLKHRHPNLRQPNVIRAQHHIMGRLRQAGFPAPKVFPTTQGDSLVTLAEELYEIHEFVAGEPYDHDRPAHLAEAAYTLGRYHARVQGLAPQALCGLGDLYSPLLLETALTNLIGAWQLDQDPSLAPVVRRLRTHATNLARRFAGHGALPHLVIHGDYYAGNLLFNGDRIVSVVDFDKTQWQPRIVELCEALIYFASPRPGHLTHLVYPGFLRWQYFAHFVQNYSQTIVLDGSEVRALPDYVCCIWMQISLERLLEKDPHPRDAPDALREVLALADWAHGNAQRMMGVGRAR
jgi:Ser/Thr protein kinase RdoA (MazF antagonist)